VNVNFGNVSQRWAGLSEEQREAWRRLAAKWPTPTSAHCQFISSATLALDAGLPEPVFPPRMRKYDPPRLKLNPDKKLKALVLSWSIPKLPDKSLADIYFCSSKASHSPDSHRHHHLAFLPAKERHFVLGDPKPNVRYSFRVRIILPDSNHSPFSAVSLVYEGF
jgi:hypothetical protein